MSGRRIELDGVVAHKDGQQFVNGRSLFNAGHTRVFRPEPHGFASHPIKGGQGLLLRPNGDADQGFILGGEHPGHRPAIVEGGTAIYDSSGNIVSLVGNAIKLTVGGVTLTISGDGLDISGGHVKHNGKNIGDSHTHGGVKSGSDSTSDPNN